MMPPTLRERRRRWHALGVLLVCAAAVAGARYLARPWSANIPRVWDEAALAEWATPLAGLNARPTHMSVAEYYALHEENLRSYPVYMPGLEPNGYWGKIQSVGPQPLIEPDRLKAEADWIAAGERVFFDSVVLRTFDPDVLAMARDRKSMEERNAGPLPDGTINGLRWLPTADGVANAAPKNRGSRWRPRNLAPNARKPGRARTVRGTTL
jgi:hypothetical protein